jgi:biotin carboxylase
VKSDAVLLLFSGSKPRHTTLLKDAVRAVHDAGLKAVCVAPSDAPRADGPDAWARYEPGPDRASRVLDAVAETTSAFHPVRVIPLFEDDVMLAALLRERLNTPGLTVEQSILFRDKNAMNVRAAELGVRTATWSLPYTESHVRTFAATHEYPIVIKPYDGVSCTDTFKVSSDQELATTWPLVQAQRHDYRIEAFVHGRQFHVDTLLRDGEILFESVGEYTAQILENLKNSPMGSVTHPAQGVFRTMLDTARRIVTSFGLCTGIAHTEFYLGDDGSITFGETAARMAGAWVPSMYEHAFGICLGYDFVRTEIDAEYRPVATASGCAGASYLWSSGQGTIEHITDPGTVAELPFVRHVEIWKSPGDHLSEVVGTRGQDLGHVVVTGASADEVRANLRKVHELFSVRTADRV